jgi:hypothetical protein
VKDEDKQTEVNPARCKVMREILEDLMKNGIPKSKKPEFYGHFNDLFLFVDAAEKLVTK